MTGNHCKNVSQKTKGNKLIVMIMAFSHSDIENVCLFPRYARKCSYFFLANKEISKKTEINFHDLSETVALGTIFVLCCGATSIPYAAFFVFSFCDR